MNETSKERMIINQSKLSHDRLIELLDYNPETGIFTNKINRGVARIGDQAGYKSHGYMRVKLGKVTYSLHRLAWFYVNRVWPRDQIDHINRIRNDNRICNLREATHSDNMLNKEREAEKRSGVEGVNWSKHGQKWRIYYNGEHFCSVDSIEEGIKARRQAELGLLEKNTRSYAPKQTAHKGITWKEDRQQWKIINESKEKRKFLGYVETIEQGLKLQKDDLAGVFVKRKRKKMSNASEYQSGVKGVVWNKYSQHWRVNHNKKYAGCSKSLAKAILIKLEIADGEYVEGLRNLWDPK